MSEAAVSDTTGTTIQSGSPGEGALALQQRSTPAPVARDGEILPPKRKRRGLILPLVILAALGGGGYEGYRWFVEGRFIVSTDDAYVKADMSTIAAKVSGYVVGVPVVENAAVSKGQVLATIDEGDYRNAVDAARARIDTQTATVARIGTQIGAQNAAIDQAKAMLQSAKADAVRYAAEFERADALVRSTYGTQQRLDQARADRDRSVAAVANATAAVTAAQAAMDVLQAQKVEAQKVKGELQTVLDKANRDLSFTTIRAPFDGVVGNKACPARAVRSARHAPVVAGAARERLYRSQFQGNPDQPVEARPEGRDQAGCARGPQRPRHRREHRPGFRRGVLPAAAGKRDRQFHQDRAAPARADRRSARGGP